MNRRELLQLLSLSSTALATPIDWDRVDSADGVAGRVDASAVGQYGAVNLALWRAYASSPTKATVFPAVREHLDILIDGLGRPGNEAIRLCLCELATEALQLAGEVFFDGDRYGDAAHCYTVATTLSKEAGAWDLWACALTRQAYLNIHDNRFAAAIPLLKAAGQVARRGDSALATRYWVEAVYAQALAGLRDVGWERAADAAQGVRSASRPNLNGWLRFDGDRLAEQRASCQVRLAQPRQAEQTLAEVLDGRLSPRRRASALVDLAAVGALNHDPVQLVMYGDAALDIARQTKSGYVRRRLSWLGEELDPLLGDPHVAHLRHEIGSLATHHAVQTT